MSTRRVQSLPCKSKEKRKEKEATSKGKKREKKKKNEEDQCGQAHVQLPRGIFVQK